MDSSRSKLPLRAAVQLIKASYAHLPDDIRGIKHRHVSNLSSLLYYFSRDVREFLSEQQIIHGDCLAECLCVAHFAALSLSQERQLYEDAARLPWRQAFYKTPFQALRIAQNICGTFGDIDLPEFEHGSLNHVIPVLESLVYSRKIVARAMYERMVSPRMQIRKRSSHTWGGDLSHSASTSLRGAILGPRCCKLPWSRLPVMNSIDFASGITSPTAGQCTAMMRE